MATVKSLRMPEARNNKRSSFIFDQSEFPPLPLKQMDHSQMYVDTGSQNANSHAFLPPLRNSQTVGGGLSRNASHHHHNHHQHVAATLSNTTDGQSLSYNNKISASISTLSSAGGGGGPGVGGDYSGSRRPSKSASAESLTSAQSSASTTGSTTGDGDKIKALTADEAAKLFGSKLSTFELTEIYNYPKIYFVGQNAKKRSATLGANNNHGFDDENGSYILVAQDHIAYRYEVLKVIGKGSFGQVIKAYDHRLQQYVALKLVRNEKRFHRQAEEEIRILDHLRKQDIENMSNVIHMLDHFTFRSHKCITFELLSINLYELVKKNKFQGFSLSLVRKFAYSMLQCLSMLNRNRLIHCDLKPGTYNFFRYLFPFFLIQFVRTSCSLIKLKVNETKTDPRMIFKVACKHCQ